MSAVALSRGSFVARSASASASASLGRRAAILAPPRSLAPPARRSNRRRPCAARATFSSDDAFTPELKKAIDAFISDNKIVLFIKGTKDFPSCGFSQTVVNIFRSMNVPFETVNILEDDRLRSGMKAYSQWPTFPQVYLNGEFFGGCDILVEAYTSGSLVEEVERAMAE